MAERVEMVVAALQQRIGEIVTHYETQVAFLRADITRLMEEKDAKAQEATDYVEHLNNLTN